MPWRINPGRHGQAAALAPSDCRALVPQGSGKLQARWVSRLRRGDRPGGFTGAVSSPVSLFALLREWALRQRGEARRPKIQGVAVRLDGDQTQATAPGLRAPNWTQVRSSARKTFA